MLKNKKAFTLIELLVVVLIIGILAAVAVPKYQKAVEKTKLSQIMQIMRTYMNALDMYLMETGLPNSIYQTRFTGDTPDTSLNIKFPFEQEKCTSYGTCENSLGNWQVYCDNTRCSVGVGDVLHKGCLSVTVARYAGEEGWYWSGGGGFTTKNPKCPSLLQSWCEAVKNGFVGDKWNYARYCANVGIIL